MPQGLQIWDDSGVLKLDVTDRLTRVLGEFDTGTVNGSISDTNLSQGSPWYISPVPLGFVNEASFTVSFTLSSISWSFGSGTGINRKITYGVF